MVKSKSKTSSALFWLFLVVCISCFWTPSVLYESSFSSAFETWKSTPVPAVEKTDESAPYQINNPGEEASDSVVAAESSTAASSALFSATNFSDSAFSLEQYTQLQEPFRSYPCLPKRIHLSQKNNAHVIPQPIDFHNRTNELVVSMTVSFSLDYANCHPDTVEPKIFYRQGFHPETTVEPNLKQTPEQFNFTSSINNTDFFQSDWIYHVEIPKVKVGRHRYWYRIEVHPKPPPPPPQQVVSKQRRLGLRLGGNSEEIKSKEAPAAEPLSQQLLGTTPMFSFSSPPLPNTKTSIALVGDLGQTENSTKTMAHIFHDALLDNKDPTTMLLIAGDMAYADSDPHRWVSWFDLMEPLTRSLPMHVAAGNHEIECDNATLEIFKQYEHYFHNPNRIAKPDLLPITQEYRQSLWDQSCSTPSEFQGHYNYGNAFYSFKHGLVHFVILSSYSDSKVGSHQYTWLKFELKRNFNRTETPWLIVSFHSPLYTTFVGHVNETQAMAMKKSMEPLFNEYNVNLVICGHDHGYMRTHSLHANGTVDPTGRAPIYLTLGAGGNREQHSKGYLNDTPEEWVAQRDLRDFGYGNLLVTNGSHALLNWIRDGVSKDGAEDKNVWIANPHYINGTLLEDESDSSAHAWPAAALTDSDEATPLGLSFTRQISKIPDGSSFQMSMNGTHCSKQDSFGDDSCHFNWGDDIIGSFAADLPSIAVLDKGDILKGSFFIDKYVPFHFQCPVCGEDCIVQAPLVHLNWSIPMPQSCPIYVNQTDPPATYHLFAHLPPTSPTKGILATSVNGTVQVIRESQTQTSSGNDSSSAQTLLEMHIEVLVK